MKTLKLHNWERNITCWSLERHFFKTEPMDTWMYIRNQLVNHFIQKQDTSINYEMYY
jgi:hypothetical protein